MAGTGGNSLHRLCGLCQKAQAKMGRLAHDSYRLNPVCRTPVSTQSTVGLRKLEVKTLSINSFSTSDFLVLMELT